MNITQTIDSVKKRYSQSNRDAVRNPWFLGWMVLVAVFLLVNFIFVIFAVTTNPGLVTEDFYEQGREYEKNAIKLHAARNALQWETRLEIPEHILPNTAGVYRFSAVDKRGLPIKDAAVELQAYRPSDASADFVTPLVQIAGGLYQSRVSFSLPGVWDITVKARHGESEFQQTHRISVIKP